jgi:hypothetical protein
MLKLTEPILNKKKMNMSSIKFNRNKNRRINIEVYILYRGWIIVRFHIKKLIENKFPFIKTELLLDKRAISNKLTYIYKNSNDLKFCFSVEGFELIHNELFNSNVNSNKVLLGRNKNGKHKGIRYITTLNNNKDVDQVKLYVNVE